MEEVTGLASMGGLVLDRMATAALVFEGDSFLLCGGHVTHATWLRTGFQHVQAQAGVSNMSCSHECVCATCPWHAASQQGGAGVGSGGSGGAGDSGSSSVNTYQNQTSAAEQAAQEAAP